jgi:two-component system chemotaxis sensor kinase CheA
VVELVDRFRPLFLDRIGSIEASWNRLVQLGDDDELMPHMLREVHTLKGDASVAGCHEVRLLCQKLEDLLEVADDLGMSEDLELVVTMAIQFAGMLLRVKPGGMAGLDLEGFVRQVDDVLREARTLPAAQREERGRRPSDAPLDRLGEQTRRRLAIAATSVYLESMAARGESRVRLREAWTTLHEELARMGVVELAPLLARHVPSAHELAASLGKSIAIDVFAPGITLDPRVAEAVDVGVLHTIRNALDHGIESDRARAGKPATGSLRITAVQGDDTVAVSVADDGAGIDVEALRARAIAGGYLDPARRRSLVELVCAPRLSTKPSAGELSGRGVGMDAVKTALTRVGGELAIATGPAGTTITMTVRAATRRVHAHRFVAPDGTVALAVSARWTATLEPASPDAIDPLRALRLPSHDRSALAIRLRWGFLERAVRASSEPRVVMAERICPTPDEHPVEVVLIDGQEALLIRPEHL